MNKSSTVATHKHTNIIFLYSSYFMPYEQYDSMNKVKDIKDREHRKYYDT